MSVALKRFNDLGIVLDYTPVKPDEDQVYCVLDYETRSKKILSSKGKNKIGVGSYEYANDPSTKVLCIAWRIGTRRELRAQIRDRAKYPAKVWSPAIPSPYGELKRALLDPKIKLVAHNAFFEQVITRFVLSKIINEDYLKAIPVDRWICTASMARYLAFPGKLEAACAALKLPVQKDMIGHRLMLKLSQPRKPTKKNPSIWHSKKSDLLRLMEYCKTDVDAETELFLAIPELPPAERKIWLLDQKINFRGFPADRPLVQKILGMISEESDRFKREMIELTEGEIDSADQRDASLNWLRRNGLDLPDIRKKTVEDALSSGLASGKARDLLLIRQASSKTSTAKYRAFEARSTTDGRLRDNLVYHTASTGRWGGAGVQPQNFPRGSIEDTDLAAEILSDPDTDLGLIRMIYGNPLDVFSSLLRSMIRAPEGKEFIGGDYGAIEVRVLFWLAKHEEGLRAYREGRDLYVEQASDIFGRRVTKENKFERQLGKKVVLGAGFGLGKDKFYDSCLQDGIEIDKDLAERAVNSYRETHWPVPRLWSNLERAAIAAVQNRGKKYSINRTSWFVENDFLFCQLPSGRRLAYYKPEIRMVATKWGEKRPKLYHWDIVGQGKKWVLNGTWGGKLTENCVQAVSRCLLAERLFAIEDAGVDVILHTHDETLGEQPRGLLSVAEYERLMSQTPAWAEGLPVVVEGWSGLRYRK